MKGTYPNTIFHFTDTIEKLTSILSEAFKLSYAVEEIKGPNETKVFGTPMVSFCDLRLSEINFVYEKYGPYGIGLKKDWAIKKGLNPVWYLNPESPLFDNFCNSLKNYFEFAKNSINPEDLKNYNESIGLWRYMKNYKGDLKRRNKEVFKNYTFANEKEWRFVPEINETKAYLFVPIQKMQTHDDKILLNEQISHIKLGFHADDISYLIIKDDSEINFLLKRISTIKENVYKNPKVVERLKSRILTSNQILEDF